MGGIEIYAPYVIDEDTVDTDVFVVPTNYEGQTMRVKCREILKEQGRYIQCPRFEFKKNNTRNRGRKGFPI